jgi:hypothetical protein
MLQWLVDPEEALSAEEISRAIRLVSALVAVPDGAPSASTHD